MCGDWLLLWILFLPATQETKCDSYRGMPFDFLGPAIERNIPTVEKGSGVNISWAALSSLLVPTFFF